jgi:hypothetical protein
MVIIDFHHVNGETAFCGNVGEQRLDLVCDVLMPQQLLSVLAGEDEVVLEQVFAVTGVMVLVFGRHDGSPVQGVKDYFSKNLSFAKKK